jgi:predicted aspartyl protease
MSAQTGFINSSGRPAINISIFGAFPDLTFELEAVIDTGFTGFISMPIVQAFPIGLPLIGTTSVVLADGNTHEKYIATCSAKLGDIWQAGIVILEPSSNDILVGMEFIQRFEKSLFLYADRQAVVLIDNADVVSFIKQALEAAQKAVPPAASADAGTNPPAV